jgi:hypothetical protein
MHSLENRFLEKIPGLVLYKRYRDDILIVSEAKKLEIHSLLEDLNSLQESIKFTPEMSDLELKFLVLTVCERKFPEWTIETSHVIKEVTKCEISFFGYINISIFDTFIFRALFWLD